MGFDITDSYTKLFARFNTNFAQEGQEEVLDAEEIAKAKNAGFNLFELKNNMTEDEFFGKYLECAPLDENSKEAAQFEQKINDIHIKYLQIQYKTNENPRQDENIESFGYRVCAMDAIKDPKYTDFERELFNKAINNPNDIDAVLNASDYFIFKEEPYSPVYNCMNNLTVKYQAALEDFYATLDKNDNDTLSRILSGDVYSAGKRANGDIEDALAIFNKYPESDGSKYAKRLVNNIAKDIQSQ